MDLNQTDLQIQIFHLLFNTVPFQDRSHPEGSVCRFAFCGQNRTALLFTFFCFPLISCSGKNIISNNILSMEYSQMLHVFISGTEMLMQI